MSAQARPLHVATCGLGVGKGHVKRLLADPRVRVVAVCDSLEDRLKTIAKENCIDRTYTDFDKMLDDRSLQLDAVTIALPNNLHAPFTVKALKKGLHVLCEKPMADSLPAAKAMLDAANKARKKLMIHFDYRFTPPGRFLKKMVQDGVIGKVYFGRTGWLRRKGIPMGTGWFSDKKRAGGGPLIDLAVHRIDMAWWLMGKPEPVSVSAATFDVVMKKIRSRTKAAGGLYTVEDLAAGMVRFKDGSVLMVEASWDGHFEKRENMWTHVLGDKGGLLHENIGEGYDFRAKVITDSGEFPVDITPAGFPRNLESVESHFVSAITEDFEPEASGKDAFVIQKILDGMYRSAAERREVRV